MSKSEFKKIVDELEINKDVILVSNNEIGWCIRRIHFYGNEFLIAIGVYGEKPKLYTYHPVHTDRDRVIDMIIKYMETRESDLDEEPFKLELLHKR